MGLGGTVAGLFPPDQIVAEADIGPIGGAAVIDPSTGSFSVGSVAAGRYVVVAFKEHDFDGNPSGEDEGFGALDEDDNRIMDEIEVGEDGVVTGVELTLRGPIPLTARELLPEILDYAAARQPGPQLEVVAGLEVDAEGRASLWSYGFSSEDEASVAAEAASGNFRETHGEVYVVATLSRRLRPFAPERAVWRFEYFASGTGDMLQIDVDAETGAVVTSSDAVEGVPRSLNIHPAYPNPFTTSTSIHFELAAPSGVRIAAYDALGREVALLNDRFLGAGSHLVEWVPSALPAGLYVVRVSTGGTQRSTFVTYVR